MSCSFAKNAGSGLEKSTPRADGVDPGETPREGVVRESQEELHITPIDPVEYGTLAFQFVDGLSLFVHAFRAETYTGTPTETDEAEPHWFAFDAIPYHEMWADDRLWVPLLLEKKRFVGRFLFDGDAMLGHTLEAAREPNIGERS